MSLITENKKKDEGEEDKIDESEAVKKCDVKIY